jgi:hypothetical protein
MSSQPLTVEVLQRVGLGTAGSGYRAQPEAPRLVLRVRWSAPGAARWLVPALAWLCILPAWLWLRQAYVARESFYMFLALGLLPLVGLWLVTQSINFTKITLDGSGVRTWHGPLRIPLVDEVGGTFVPLAELARFEVHRQQRVRVGVGNTLRSEEVFFLVGVHTSGRVSPLSQSATASDSYHWLSQYLQEYLDHVVRPASGPIA